MIHLDTSFLIRSLVRESEHDTALRRWLRAGEPLGISAVAWTEFLCGPLQPETAGLATSILGPPIAFGEAEAELAARLFNETGRRRGSLTDCMIAATALRQDARLATADTRDFATFSPAGLEIV